MLVQSQGKYYFRTRGAALLAVILGLIIVAVLGLQLSRVFQGTKAGESLSTSGEMAIKLARTGGEIVASQLKNTFDQKAAIEQMLGKTYVLRESADGTPIEQFTVQSIATNYWTVDKVSSDGKTITAKSPGKPLFTKDDLENSPHKDNSLGEVGVVVSDPLGPTLFYPIDEIKTLEWDDTHKETEFVVKLKEEVPILSGDIAFAHYIPAGGAGGSVPTVSKGSLKLNDSKLGMIMPKQNGLLLVADKTDKTYGYSVMGDTELVGLTYVTGGASGDQQITSGDFQEGTLVPLPVYQITIASTMVLGGERIEGSYAMIVPKSESEYKLMIPDYSKYLPKDKLTSTSQLSAEDRTSGNVFVRSWYAHQKPNASYNYVTFCSPSGEGIEQLARMKEGITDHWFEKGWKHNRKIYKKGGGLSYDMQIKIGQGYRLLTGNQGLLFRLSSEIESDNPLKESNFLGVSIMKYYEPNESSKLPNSSGFDVLNFKPDLKDTKGRSDDVMPPDTYSSISKWNGRVMYSLKEKSKTVLVLWWQTFDESTKEEVRDWIAYKVLSELEVPDTGTTGDKNIQKEIEKTIEQDLGPAPLHWDKDGRITNDNSTLLVRLEEQVVGSRLVNFIKVFYGDTAERWVLPKNRSADESPYSYVQANEKGKAQRSSSVASRFDSWPGYWPAYDLTKWKKSDDKFTLLGLDSQGQESMTWDGFNPDLKGKTGNSLVRPMGDGTTIILYDDRFTSEDSNGNFISKDEVAFYAKGYTDCLTSSKGFIFADWAIRLLMYNDDD